MRRYLTERPCDPGSDRALCSAPLPPPPLWVVGGVDDNDMDWVARGLSSSGDGSIVVSTLRWLSTSLSLSGGDRGGGREAHGIPGRGENDEYRGRKVQEFAVTFGTGSFSYRLQKLPGFPSTSMGDEVELSQDK